MSKWWWKADYIETCNCAHGCSCNLTMIPTDGTCQAIDAWKIREGAFDTTVKFQQRYEKRHGAIAKA